MDLYYGFVRYQYRQNIPIICDGACVFYCYDTSRIIMMEADIMQNGINPYHNSVIELAADKHGHALG